MITELLNNFINNWAIKDSASEPFVVQDTGNAYCLIIKNTCEWYKKHGGCTMCNYTDHTGVNAAFIISNYSETIIHALSSLNKKYARIKLYINGSFFNENELNQEIGIEFIKRLHEELNITELCIETRPEYITRTVLLDFIHKTGVNFEICFGLETTNDVIRNQCFHKGFTYFDFLRIYHSIKDLCKVKVYLLIKPPFVSERYAIKDVINSVETLVNEGITRITYKPVAVQENTLLEFLLQENLYRPVWIWSIIEINSRLKEVRAKYPDIHLGKLDYFPKPLQKAFNCEKCTEDMFKLLMDNRNLCWGDFSLECDCCEEWKYYLRKEQNISIQQAISIAEDAFLRSVDRSKFIYSMANSNKPPKVLQDIAKTTPINRLVLDNVGIEKVHIPIKIESYQAGLGCCKYSIELDPFHRGIHMSRLIERLNSFSQKVHKDILDDMANDLMIPSISTNAEIVFTIMDTNSNLPTNNSNYIFIDLACRVFQTSNNIKNKHITISIPFINACPCTKETVQELFDKTFTHTQRGRITISFKNCTVSFNEIILFGKKYISVFDLLKREDEIYIVNKAYNNALFCEDICREVTQDIKKYFSSSKGSVYVRVVTEESIHPHNAFAEKSFELR